MSRPKARAAARAPQPRTPEPPAAPWWERVRPWHAALALACLHLVLAGFAFDPTPHTGGDSAAYLALARSMLERGTYQELWDPAMRPHSQYPPVWPMLMALGAAAGIRTWIGFKLIVTAFSAVAIAFSYLWARRAAGPGIAMGAGVALAMGPGVVDLAHWELSDVPFWAFGMIALWAFTRLPPRDEAEPEGEPVPALGRRAYLPMAVAALGTLAAYATRSAGIPLVAAAVAWLGWRRRWRELGLLAAVVLPYAIAWWIRGKTLGAPGYTSFLWQVDPYRPDLGTIDFLDLLSRIGRNTSKYVTNELPNLLVGTKRDLLGTVVAIAVVGLAAAGWTHRMRRPGVAEIWLPLYLGLLLVWPAEWAGDRFLLPALPVLLVCAAEALAMLGRSVRHPVAVGSVAVAVLALMVVPSTVQATRDTAQCRREYAAGDRFPCLLPTWKDFLAVASAVRGKLPEGSVVISRKPTLFWAMSGYPSRTYPFVASTDSLLARAREARARYVVVDQVDNLAGMYLAPSIVGRPAAFCVVYTQGPERSTMMGIRPNADSIAGSGNKLADGQTVTLSFKSCDASFVRPDATGTAVR